MKSTIYPYLLGSVWVFDDETTGLKAEAFVCGMSEMISRLIRSKRVADARSGFCLMYSNEPFDDADVTLQWLRADDPDTPMSGNWYSGNVAGSVMQGWVCPALLLYFGTPPSQLFIKADPLPKGVDPIWHVHPDDPHQRRFMNPND